LGTRSAGTRLLKGTVTYLHPLLSSPHRFQVTSYRCRADKIIYQKFESIPTSRGGLKHRRRTDRLRVLDFWRTDDYLQANLRQGIATHLFGHPGGLLSPPAQLLLQWPPRFPAQRLQSAQPQGWRYPRLLPLSTQDIRDQFPGGFDYYSRKAALLQRTYLLLHWLMTASRSWLEGGERTPRWQARKLLPPPPC
jgi:hypothetical protein